jgi:aspartyl-tRNA(Asn)/glutamyl-tRNA(Gln) amidotransferase subunit C
MSSSFRGNPNREIGENVMMNMNTKKNIVAYVATLAKLDPSEEDGKVLETQVESTIDYISRLAEIDTANVPPTSQVTGLKNVFREDVVDKKRILEQKDALAGAKRTHNGFFVVKGLFGD